MKHLIAAAVIVVVVLGQTAVRAEDVNHDGYETILFPIALAGAVSDRVPGAFGTVWQGEVWVRNASGHTIFLQPNPPCAMCGTSQVGPLYVGRLVPDTAPSGMRGFLLTPRSDEAAALTFSNRILEATRHSQPQGFEVPVVREGQFFTGPTDFLGLIGGGSVRVMLRVYDPRRVSGSSFTVELIDATGKTVDQTMIMTTFSSTTPFDFLEPGFVALDVTASFPKVTGLDRYHLRVTPTRPGAEYWAMASITDNDTQQVVIVTPQ